MLGIRMRRGAVAGVVAAIAASATTAHAMQFHVVTLDDGVHSVIQATGPIIPGDMERLHTLVGAMPSTDILGGFVLDSPGGNLDEAVRFANVVHEFGLPIYVLGGAQCSSACFLIFAASPHKFVAPDALIGVHSASIAGQETPDSMAMTTAMAREAATLGVPAAIIGKMVETNPNRMEWLTPDDLASMDVVVIQPKLQAPPAVANAAPPTANAAAPAAPSPSDATATTSSSPSDEPPDFQQGLADRGSWETWYASLSGDYQRGAFFWSAHRTDPRPPSCYPNGQNVGDWTAGCLAAQQRLASSDVRRKTDPVYRQGWNSY